MALTTEVTPAKDEPEDTKYLKTQVELVTRLQLAVDDAHATSGGGVLKMQ